MTPFPFSAIVAQDDLKLALLLNALDPLIGGVLVRGHKGTAKSTAVRALAALLPAVEAVVGCPYSCDPQRPDPGCPAGPHDGAGDLPLGGVGDLVATTVRGARLVELPVGATEDRVAGSLDIERALTEGARAFEPGLLARAHRGVLYVDEVNLLNDHLVDLLLDAAAMGRNHVEREGISVSHPARFLLVGTMNPEEGELRPQLLDRFGLTVEVAAPVDADLRATVVRRRLAYDRDHDRFAAAFADDEEAIAVRLQAARKLLPEVVLTDRMLTRIAQACAAFEVDGLRADIVIARTATAVAAWEGRTSVALADVRTACLLALPHRRRRGPFEQPGLDQDELDRVLGADDEAKADGAGDDASDEGPDDRGPGGGGPGGGGPEEDGPEGGGPDGPGGGGPDGRGGGGRGGGPDGAGSSSDGGEAPAGEQPPGRRDTFGRDPGDPGRDTASSAAASRDDAPAGADEVEVHGVGAAFAPTLLTVPGVGAGAWGRRSAARGDHGATVGARPVRAGDRRSASDLAVAATLRAAAPHQHARGREGAGLALRGDDLRRKIRQGREGNLVVFLVDASGSMAARRRMVAVKGAIRSLLLDAYQRRDKIALITFRGVGADLVLPPTASADLAERRLADLPTGGRTPLAAGLQRVGEVLAVESVRDPDRRPLVVVLTDGRANAAPAGSDAVAGAQRAGRSLAARQVATVVVDTEEGFVRLGLARQLAAAMAAPCLQLSELAAGPLAGAVRTMATPPRPGARAA